MRKLGLWGGWAVLLLALGAAVVSAGPPADDDDDLPAEPAGPDPAARPRDGWNPFLTRVFGGHDEKKPAPKPDKDSDVAKADKKADAPAPRPSAREEIAARVIALEKAKLRRRQDVCLRLREIARETQDDALEQKAIQLDQLAFEVYQERTLQAGGGASDEDRLEQKLPTGSSGAAARLTAPAGSGGKGDGGSTASVREVRP
jgi:hypothetical protein